MLGSVLQVAASRDLAYPLIRYGIGVHSMEHGYTGVSPIGQRLSSSGSSSVPISHWLLGINYFFKYLCNMYVLLLYHDRYTTLNWVYLAMIVLYIWRVESKSQWKNTLTPLYGTPHLSRLQTVMKAVIESGLLYTVTSISVFFTCVTRSNAIFITSAAVRLYLLLFVHPPHCFHIGCSSYWNSIRSRPNSSHSSG